MKNAIVSTVAALVAALLTANVQAARQTYVAYTYYSDATHTQQVGFQEFFCPAGSNMSGVTSPWKVLHMESCNDYISLGIPPVDYAPGYLPQPPDYYFCYWTGMGDTWQEVCTITQ